MIQVICPPNRAGRSRPVLLHDGAVIVIGVLPRGHLLWGPTRLASLTPGHRLHSFGWDPLAVSSALWARVPGEGVCIPKLPARPVLERDVIGVDHVNSSRWLSYQVLTSVKPAYGTVIRPDRDLLSVEITFEVFQCLDHCQQLLAGRAVPLLAPLQRLTDVGNDTLLPVLNLGQHRSRPDIARVGVEVPQPIFTGKP